MMAKNVSDASGGALLPALYLLPSAMSDGSVDDVIPAGVRDVARRCRYFVVENVRTVRRYLKRIDRDIDIDALTFNILDEHTAPADVPPMLDPILRGEAVAVVSEAGCPAIADPGADLVAAAQRRGIKVVPLVGPSCILLALMASGFNGQSFSFVGYLPVDAAPRAARLREMLRRIDRERQTQIFIETPYRNDRLVRELVATLPPRTLLCVASDITGPAESIITRSLADWRRALDAGAVIPRIPTIFLLFS